MPFHHRTDPTDEIASRQPRRKRMKLAAALITIATSITIAVTPTASADTRNSLALCNAGYDGITQSVFLWGASASGGVSYTRAFIEPGDVIRVTARGEIKNDAWPWNPAWSPNGSSSLAPHFAGDWRAGGLSKYSLIGFFSDRIVQLGTNTECIVYDGNRQHSRFSVDMNDDFFEDNTGYWDIVIHHYP
jgi:hypothetical protein